MNHELSDANWFKSTHSSGQTDCVEVAWLATDRVGVRDSKNPGGPALVFTAAAWDSFASWLIDG